MPNISHRETSTTTPLPPIKILKMLNPNAPLSIRLTENISFLRGSATGEDGRGRVQLASTDAPPTVLRGLLTMKLTKPSRIRKIEIRLEGKSRTEWPEGIGPRRTETSEEHTVISSTLTFFDATSSSSSPARNRFGGSSGGGRALSVGPGNYMDGSRDLEEDDEDEDEFEEQEDLLREGEYEGDDDGRGRSGFARVGAGSGGSGSAGYRSMSAFPLSGTGIASTSSSSSSTAATTRPPNASPSVPRGRALPQHQHNQSLLQSHQRHSQPDLDRERGPSPAYSSIDTLRSPNAMPSAGSPLAVIRPRAESFRRERDEGDLMEGDEDDADNGENVGSGTEMLGRPAMQSLPSEGDIGGLNLDRISLDEPGSGRESAVSSRPDPTPPSPNSHSASQRPTSIASPALTPIAGSPAAGNSSASSSSTSIGGGTGPNGTPSSRSLRERENVDYVNVTRPGSRQSSIVERIPSPAATPPASIHEGMEGHHGHRGSISGLMGRSGLGPGRKPSVNGLQAASNGHANNTDGPDRHRSSSNASSSATATGHGHGDFGPATSSDRRNSNNGPAPKHHFFSSLRGFSRSRSKAPSESSPDSRDPKNSIRSPHPPATAAKPNSSDSGRMLSPDPVDRFGRGGGGSGRDHSRGRGGRLDNHSPGGSGSRASRSPSVGVSGSRGRTPGVKVFGGFSLEEDGGGRGEGHGWKEFKKGIYNYPISFSLPASLPPSIHADFGSIVYKLKATVFRHGALTSNLTEEQEVFLIASPSEDDTEESENIVVERQWEEQMRYVIALSGKSFPIGGQLPMSIRIVPMSKCAMFRLSATIEEKIDYFAMDKKVARHEAVKKYPLLALKGQEKPTMQPLLPIISSAPDAFAKSPLAPFAYLAAEGNETPDDAAASLLNPVGPWHMETNLQVPDCVSRIRFSTKHAPTQVTVSHWLKVVMRMERGDLVAVDAKGKKKQFDIIIETPLHLLDCRVNNQWNSLPTYAVRRGAEGTGQPTGVVCRVHGIGGPRGPPGAAGSGGDYSSRGPTGISSADPRRPPSVAPSVVTSTPASQLSSSTRRTSEIQEVEGDDSLLERNIVFDRLVSGQESELGEAPPTYEDALKRRSRSRSKAAGAARSRSRLGLIEGEMLRRTPSPAFR